MTMDSGFPYGDIIVIGAIAAFILLRYRAMLGEQRGRDETSARPTIVPANERERVITIPSSRVPSTDKKDDFSSKYGSLAGARAAYEMVITAFSKRDRDTLKMLLSNDMYKSFDLSLTDAEKEKRFSDTTLTAISKATIANAKLSGSMATITVDIVSEQIHLIRDENGVILEGNPSEQHLVEDQWVFTRDLKNANPNWSIIET
jgi:predicted lipid-binding transport protein (Tim44 family)